MQKKAKKVAPKARPNEAKTPLLPLGVRLTPIPPAILKMLAAPVRGGR